MDEVESGANNPRSEGFSGTREAALTSSLLNDEDSLMTIRFKVRD